MHISCPRCDKTINAKNYNLFQIWECKDCEWRFRGVHASQPVCLNFVFEFVAPLYHGPHINDIAECPLCFETIKLRWIWSTSPGRDFGPFRRKGYDGPYVCHACRNPLPWDYPDQKPHVKKAHDKWVDEYNRLNGFVTEEDKSPSENERFVESANEVLKEKDEEIKQKKQEKNVLSFSSRDVFDCFKHAVESKEWNMYEEGVLTKPALFLIHDEKGFYLKSNGKDFLDKNIVYAIGGHAKLDKKSYQETKDSIGEEHFIERIEINESWKGMLQDYKLIKIRITEEDLEINFSKKISPT